MNKYDFKTSDIVVKNINNNSFYLCSKKLTKELIDIILKYVKSDNYSDSYLIYLKENINSEHIVNILPNYELDAVITDIKDYCMENKLSFKIVK